MRNLATCPFPDLSTICVHSMRDRCGSTYYTDVLRPFFRTRSAIMGRQLTFLLAYARLYYARAYYTFSSSRLICVSAARSIVVALSPSCVPKSCPPHTTASRRPKSVGRSVWFCNRTDRSLSLSPCSAEEEKKFGLCLTPGAVGLDWTFEQIRRRSRGLSIAAKAYVLSA